MKEFICIQNFSRIDNNIVSISTLVRNVLARNREEAIGKFILNVAEETKGLSQSPIECFLLKQLLKIK